MANPAVGRWSRRFAAASAWFFAALYLARLAGAGRRAVVALALFGAVFHMVFGKAYLLVPSYFERVLSVAAPLPVHFALATTGTAALALAGADAGPDWLAPLGAGAWALGTVLFAGALAWTLRDNLTGRATGTQSLGLDRYANAFVPVSVAYLLAGSYAALAGATGLPAPVDGYPPRATHLLAAGSAALLLFALGARLLPRFLGGDPPRAFAVALPAGAVGPALIAASLGADRLFLAGALAEVLALVAFAVGFLQLFRDSPTSRVEGEPPSRRVGEYAVLAGVVSGVLLAVVGASLAVRGYDPALVSVHHRLALSGFLGLSIVGFAYEFYPPTAGEFVGASDRAAAATIALLAGGLAVECAGLLARFAPAERAGVAVGLAGAVGYAALLTKTLQEK